MTSEMKDLRYVREDIDLHRERWQRLVNTVAGAWNGEFVLVE